MEYPDDYARTVAKDEFWYPDTDPTNVTAQAATNKGIRARALLSQGDPTPTVKTVIPLNRYSFFQDLSDRLLPPMQLEFEVTLRRTHLPKRRHQSTHCCHQVRVVDSPTAAVSGSAANGQ